MSQDCLSGKKENWSPVDSRVTLPLVFNTSDGVLGEDRAKAEKKKKPLRGDKTEIPAASK